MGKTLLTLWHHSKEETLITIVENLSFDHPSQSFSEITLSKEVVEDLVDPLFNVRRPIDAIIGVDIMAKSLRSGMYRGPHGFSAQETAFGWIAFGGGPQMDGFDALASVNVWTITDVYKMVKKIVSIDRKFRVVFDAATTTTNSRSLNDVQYDATCQQRDLVDVIMSFCVGRCAVTSDIAKMFRQIEIRREHWDYQ